MGDLPASTQPWGSGQLLVAFLSWAALEGSHLVTRTQSHSGVLKPLHTWFQKSVGRFGVSSTYCSYFSFSCDFWHVGYFSFKVDYMFKDVIYFIQYFYVTVVERGSAFTLIQSTVDLPKVQG